MMTNWNAGKYNITLPQKSKPAPDVAKATDIFPLQSISPIALDINKSGAIETTSLASSTTYFDIDNDKFAERVQWISPTDGWLAMDRNGNGKIDNQSELFGDNGGTTAYSKLAALNTNNTGTSANAITSADTAFAQLRVWIDGNSDGVSQASELKTLSSLGITSLGLESSAGSLTSTFVRSGVTYNAKDIYLDTDQRDSWYQGSASEITLASLTLPQSRGYGDVKSMQYAASGNAALFNKVQALDSLPITALDTFYAQLEAMVEEWTGCATVARDGSTPYLDMRHLAIMSKFAGVVYTADTFTSNVISLAEGYNKLLNEFATRFIAQGTLATVFGNPSYSFSDDRLHFSLSYSQILANAKASVPTDATDKNVYWSEIARTLLQYSGDFAIAKPALQAAIDSAAGYSVTLNQPWNYIVGGAGNDSLSGSSLKDFINGVDGNDTLSGGDGNDSMNGGNGNDLVHGNDGNDRLADYAGINTIYGDAGNDDLYGGTGSSKLYGGVGNDTIAGGYASETLSGGDGNDTIRSGNGNDSITGDAGNDQLTGGLGNSTLSGGLGADTLSGGAGTDTFRYTKGDGDDMIAKATTATTTDVLTLTNIARSGVTFSVVADSTALNEPNSVKINIAGGGSILLAKHLDGSNAGQIASIKFSDGTSMTAAQITQAAATVGTTGNDTILGSGNNDVLLGFAGADSTNGGAGNDTIYGQAGNDTLVGSTGNDLLKGGDGDDTYRYARGDGDDTIADFGAWPQDMLILDTIARNEVSFSAIDTDASGTADSIKLNIANGGSILLQDQIFLSAYYTIDSVKFSDGIIMTAQQINDALSPPPPVAQVGTAGNDTLYGDGNNNIISGAAGNDKLIGNAGDDSLSGDADNDTVWGGDGLDMILGGNGADQLMGDKGNASIVGGNDSIDGGAGNDTIFAEGGNDTAIGGDGDDNMQGQEGNDLVLGGTGNDTLWGQNGNDTLNGGAGKDQMTGGAGVDVFIFSNLSDSQTLAPDYIWDFTHGVDKITMQGLGFARLDTDGGMTEAGELRFSGSGITTVTSDQTGFTFQLNGTFTTATLTDSDFVW